MEGGGGGVFASRSCCLLFFCREHRGLKTVPLLLLLLFSQDSRRKVKGETDGGTESALPRIIFHVEGGNSDFLPHFLFSRTAQIPNFADTVKFPQHLRAAQNALRILY